MQKDRQRCYPAGKCWKPAGYALLAAGIILLFACIPGWAWMALFGLVLMAAGYLVLKLCKTWR